MEKKHKLGTEFNETVAGNAHMVTYADATSALKQEMEKAMTAIAARPDSFDAVLNDGTGPVLTLGKFGIKGVPMNEEVFAEAQRQVCLYFGAAPEVLRRYEEEFIPAARKQFEATGHTGDQKYLDDVLQRKEDFIERLQILQGALSASAVLSRQLVDAREANGRQGNPNQTPPSPTR
jgi:hypothetical protein